MNTVSSWVVQLTLARLRWDCWVTTFLPSRLMYDSSVVNATISQSIATRSPFEGSFSNGNCTKVFLFVLAFTAKDGAENTCSSFMEAVSFLILESCCWNCLSVTSLSSCGSLWRYESIHGFLYGIRKSTTSSSLTFFTAKSLNNTHSSSSTLAPAKEELARRLKLRFADIEFARFAYSRGMRTCATRWFDGYICEITATRSNISTLEFGVCFFCLSSPVLFPSLPA
mmetsp:Transcript_30553/g.48944  ORF Transcript_30553/g.48944 Transcript_30553/m.48944 type:complete len:226 (-) Transcript_30553:2505-3182(-)